MAKAVIPKKFTNLQSDRIMETIGVLADRIEERFPNAGLSHVCRQLGEISRKAGHRASSFGRPMWLLRMVVFLLMAFILMLPVWIFLTIKMPTLERLSIIEIVQTIEAATNEIIIVGALIIALTTIEGRMKRSRALAAIHELRSLCHIIDMHQLTKDPERLVSQGRNTASSPQENFTRFELARYLNYCSEMLSLIGKISAIYVQHFPDSQTVEAVNDIEQLSTGLSQKIWQKIMILNTLLPLSREEKLEHTLQAQENPASQVSNTSKNIPTNPT